LKSTFLKVPSQLRKLTLGVRVILVTFLSLTETFGLEELASSSSGNEEYSSGLTPVRIKSLK
jgi:hypothetical protein